MKTVNPEWKKPCSAKRGENHTFETIVVPKAEHKRFDKLMGDLHYLGSATPTGDFLRQAVVRGGEWAALLAWGLACYALRDRDEWIGWHPAQRAKIGLPLKRGTKKFRKIPTYAVFYNLLRRTDPKETARILTEWLGERAGNLPGALAMDGKFIRDTVGVLTLADHEIGAPEAETLISLAILHFYEMHCSLS